MKPTPKSIVITKLNRFALDALRRAGVSDIKALQIVNSMDPKRRELAEEAIKELEATK